MPDFWLTRVRNFLRSSFIIHHSSFQRRLLLEWLEDRTLLSGFTNVTGTALPNIPGVFESSVAWGDYNNDGQLDFLLTGLNNSGVAITQLWQNNGDGTFTNVTSSAFPSGAPPGVDYSSVVWGDYNNNGQLDFLLTGLNNSGIAVTQLWQNNGNGTFTNVTSTAFPGGAPPGVYSSSVAWGDYNDNGHLGFLLTGDNNAGTAITQLWQNNGNGTFTNVTSTAFPGGTVSGVSNSSVAWADDNNDGSLDFLLTGLNNSGNGITQLWQNNGNGTFTNVTSSAFSGGAPPGVYNSAVAWGDDNNNGHLDFLLTGLNNSGAGVTQLWQNNGNGAFTNATSTAFPGGAPSGVYYSSVVWGDYNNDGSPDFLLTGETNAGTFLTQLWQNNGPGTFTNVAGTGFPGVIQSSAAWGDYNRDGSLDLLLTGQNASGNGVTQLWQNNESTPDAAPSAPTQLQATVNNLSVTFSWQAPTTSGSTPTNGLSYDLRVGTTSGGDDILSAIALSNGTLTSPENNTLVHGLSYTLQGLTLGKTYYWSVQAVDNAFNGSPFAAGTPFSTGGTLSVTLNPSNDTVTAGQPATFTAAANGSPNPAVQWEVSTNSGASYAPISGATSDTLSFTAAANNNGNQYEAVFSNAQGNVTTTAATLTVLFAPTVTLNPSSDTVTAGQSATFLTTASGNPTPSVQWEVSTNGGVSYTPITGAASDTLTFTSAANQNGNWYEAVFTNAQGSATTTPAALTVLFTPSITLNPSSDTVAASQPVTFLASANGSPAPSVQWEISINGGANYTAISGATSTTLTFTTAANDNGNQYEAVFSNTQGSATTTAAVLTVLFAPSVTLNPSSDTVTAGQPATFTAAANGNPIPSVQWEVSTNGGISYTAIPGATSDTLTFATTANDNGDLYETIFSNSQGSATTTPAALTVLFAPSVTLNPSSDTVTAGQPAMFLAAAGGNPNPAVQWEVSTNSGASYDPIPGATSDTLTLTTAANDNGNWYEAVFSNPQGSATTATAALTVLFAPTVTLNPSSNTVAAGQPAIFTAATNGNPSPTVQWAVSSDGGVSYDSIPDATSDTLTFTTTADQNGNWYEAVFSNAQGSTTTTAAFLTVLFAPSITLAPANDTVSAGEPAAFLAAANGNPNPSVQWEVSTNGGASYTAIPGATSDTLTFTPGASDNGNWYEAVFTNAQGSATTAPAALTVFFAPTITSYPSSDTVTASQSATLTASANGDPEPAVQWQVSTNDGASYNPIPSATSDTLTFATTANDNGDLYEAIFSNAQGSTTTTPATLTVLFAPTVALNPSNDTVTAGQPATFAVVANGNLEPSVQWEVSTDNGVSYTAIPGTTSDTLTFTTMANDNGNQYEAVFSNAQGSTTTTAAVLTVLFAPTVTLNPSSDTVTAVQSAIFTVAASGNPNPSVQWEISTDSGTDYTAIPGATSDTLTFMPAASDTGNWYEAMFTNAQGSATTTAATLTVLFAPSVTLNPSSDTVAAGQSAAFTALASGNLAPTVQWEVSTDGGITYMAISGATSDTLAFLTTANDNGDLYTAVFSNAQGDATSTPAALTVLFAPTVTLNPSNDTVAVGQSAMFTAAANGNPAPSVQWEVSANNGVSYIAVPGATSDTLTFTTTANDNGNQYEAVFVNAQGSVTTAFAALTVLFPPTITLNPFPDTVIAGQPAIFTAAASGNPNPAVQWEVSTDDGTNYMAVPGATSDTLTFTPAANDNGDRYEAVFNNTQGSATTTPAALTVLFAPSVTLAPANDTVSVGQPATFQALANGNLSPTVQWVVSTDGGASFTPISGATADTLTFTPTANDNGNWYEAVFSNAQGSVTTAAAVLSVLFTPSVTLNPSNNTVIAGQPVVFLATAGGNPAPSVQWEVSSNGGASYTSITGATSDTLTFTSAANQNGNWYEAVFSNTQGSGTTTAAALTVLFAPSVTLNPSSDTVTAGQPAMFLAAASGNPSPGVQWEVSSNGGASYTAIPDATSDTLTFTTAANNNGNLYAAVFSNAQGSTTTTAAVLTVLFAPTVTFNPSNDTVTAGQSATFTAAANGNLEPSVQWEVSANNGTSYTAIPGATSDTLTFSTTPNDNGDLYEAVFSNAQGSTTTTAAVLTVLFVPTVTSGPSADTVSAGQPALFLATGSGNPNPAVQWQVSSNGGVSYQLIPDATSDTLTFTTAANNNGDLYEAVFRNAQGSATTAPAALTVLFAPSVALAPANDTVSAGQPALFQALANGNLSPTVQWVVSTDGGASFTPISGATADTLTFTPTANDNGDWYEAVFSNAQGSVTTAAAVLTVLFAPSVTLNPSDNTVIAGRPMVFLATADANPLPSVQWEISSNGGASYTAISGAASDTLTFTSAANQNGNWYEAVFHNAQGSATTTPAMLTVLFAPTVTLQPSDDTVAAGQSATFTAAANGNPASTVQWQVSTDGGVSYTAIPGAASDTLTFTPAANDNGNWYEAVFRNAQGSATTTPAALTVLFAPSVTLNPSSDTVTAGEPATFLAVATGNPNPSVQWEVSSNSGASYIPISGATSDTLTFTATASDNGHWYEAVFSNAQGNAMTTPVALSVLFAPVVAGNPSNDTVPASQSATFTATGDANPLPSVQWEVSTNGGASYTVIPDATSDTLTVPTAVHDNGNRYEAVFSNAQGNATTTPAALTVLFAPTVTLNPSSDTVSAGQSATFTATANGNPLPSVQWEVSSNGGVSYTPIPGAASDTFTFTTAANDNGNQYAAVFTNSQGSVTTTLAELGVESAELGTKDNAGVPSSALPAPSSTVAVFDPATGIWTLDDPATGSEETFVFGAPGDTGIVGDWNGAGFDEVGVYRVDTALTDPSSGKHPLLFSLNVSGTGVWNPAAGDQSFLFGLQGDTVVVGDWNGDGKEEVGVVRPGSDGVLVWSLDVKGASGDHTAYRVDSFGLNGDEPIVGDWNGAGKTEIGTVRNTSSGLIWSLDVNGDGVFDAGDACDLFGGAGAVAVVGDWTGSGKTEIGTYQRDANGIGLDFSLDFAGQGVFTTPDPVDYFGSAGDGVIIGDWNGQGKAEIGTYRLGGDGQQLLFTFDTNGDGSFDAGDQMAQISVSSGAGTQVFTGPFRKG